jgi:hypothetical protein
MVYKIATNINRVQFKNQLFYIPRVNKIRDFINRSATSQLNRRAVSSMIVGMISSNSGTPAIEMSVVESESIPKQQELNVLQGFF